MPSATDSTDSQVLGTPTGACLECCTCWRGPAAHSIAERHEYHTGHVVWCDLDAGTVQHVNSGPFPIRWDAADGSDFPHHDEGQGDA